MSEKIHEFGILDDLLSKAFKNSKKEMVNRQQSFHQKIQYDKKFLLDSFLQKSFYKEYHEMLEKNSKGVPYYRGLIKKGVRNNQGFFRLILNSISKVNDALLNNKYDYKKQKLKRNYSLSELELMKRKKYKFEKQLLQKQKEKEKQELNDKEKSNSTICDINKPTPQISQKDSLAISGINTLNLINKNISKNDTIDSNNSTSEKYTFVSNNLTNNESAKLSEISENLKEERIRKFNSILNLCKEEIKYGQKVGGKFEKFSTKLNDNLYNMKKNRENKEDRNIEDQKILVDKKNKNDKYKELEENKFNELKKKIDTKVSDVYAYFNRKEFREYVNNKEKDEEYEMYLRDIRKITNDIELKRIKEKEKMVEIVNLLDDASEKKNYLKSVIAKFRVSYEKEKENEKNKKVGDDNNGEFSLFYKKKIILPKIEKRKLYESPQKIRRTSPYNRNINSVGKIKRVNSQEKILGKNSMDRIFKGLKI